MEKADQCHKDAHILIVEDEALVRMSTVGWLEDYGCNTLEAGSADDAVEIIEQHPEIKVLFTDIETPGKLDGLQLAHMVKAKWPSITVVISSGRVLPPKNRLPDGVRFIAKPYHNHDLEAIAHASSC
jgi:CheY-like chemotaxis protein